MKIRLRTDLQEIEKCFKSTDIVRVPARMFDEILRTYPAPKRAKFILTGIEWREGKFIKPLGMQ